MCTLQITYPSVDHRHKSKNIRKKIKHSHRQINWIRFQLCFLQGVRDIHYNASTFCISCLALEGRPSVSWCLGAETICWLLTGAYPPALACRPTTQMEARWWFQAMECALQGRRLPKVAQLPICKRTFSVVAKKEKES